MRLRFLIKGLVLVAVSSIVIFLGVWVFGLINAKLPSTIESQESNVSLSCGVFTDTKKTPLGCGYRKVLSGSEEKRVVILKDVVIDGSKAYILIERMEGETLITEKLYVGKVGNTRRFPNIFQFNTPIVTTDDPTKVIYERKSVASFIDIMKQRLGSEVIVFVNTKDKVWDGLKARYLPLDTVVFYQKND
jgi:hypothetical protein